ncbi:SDR family NAD(P)-dependent oxidoreductase [Paeniroseomonas aquatica]|uniref:Glucose 1-dehydrogenase n=1 Tax=Paeniroseomonas aquatica TaxID=373043 RepID=A0ABT8A0A7_9PROT|nr:glucose 1-dehydrogenase [Paeniroseomonas aquatica]MDN3563056.1 glucose 1-dehydrogenase [Paeniroseomonas aquatica]
MGRRLAGKVALVTGAGGGIGAAICRRYAEEGAQVVVTDIDAARAAAVAAGIGGASLSLGCDAADPAQAEAAVAAAVARFGALHVLVNNAAAFTADATAETIPLAAWERTLAVNLTGPMLMSRFAIPAMRAAGGGSIIHMASQLGHVGREGRFWYCTAKAALIHMARCMAIDHAADGIRVNSLSPGPIATERTVARIGGPEAGLAFYGPLTLLGRQGRPEEIADAALFLAADESRYMTGADLLVDGGYTAR